MAEYFFESSAQPTISGGPKTLAQASLFHAMLGSCSFFAAHLISIGKKLQIYIVLFVWVFFHILKISIFLK